MGNFNQLETGTVRCLREKRPNTAGIRRLGPGAFFGVVSELWQFPLCKLFFSPAAGKARRWNANRIAPFNVS
jgi:hypothetical protein